MPDMSGVIGNSLEENGSRSKVQFVKCPHCSFENIHPEVIAHIIKYSHTTLTNIENASKSDETGTTNQAGCGL